MIAEKPSTSPPARSMASITLYQISREYAALGELLEESAGEITPEIEDLWNGLADSLDAKIDGYCSLIRQFQHGADAAKAEAKRLTDLARARENAAARLKERLKQNLELMGFQKHQTALFTVRIQANPTSYRWAGPVEQIPAHWQRVTIALDVAAVKEALKSEQFQAPEALVVERGSHLRIA